MRIIFKLEIIIPYLYCNGNYSVGKNIFLMEMKNSIYIRAKALYEGNVSGSSTQWRNFPWHSLFQGNREEGGTCRFLVCRL